MSRTAPTITVGELKQHLAIYKDHYEISFGGLEFNRVKQRGDTLIQIEFIQQVYLNQEGKVVVENLD
jgi:hypothetical protein